MSRVLEHLYISGEKQAHDRQWLQEHNIGHIVNCAMEIRSKFPTNFRYLNLNMDDVPGEDISRHFQRSFEFIEDAREHGKATLVHCAMGISRSATIVLYYLMRKFNLTYEEAFDYLSNKRNIVWPNRGFRHVLKTLSKIYNRR